MSEGRRFASSPDQITSAKEVLLFKEQSGKPEGCQTSVSTVKSVGCKKFPPRHCFAKAPLLDKPGGH